MIDKAIAQSSIRCSMNPRFFVILLTLVFSQGILVCYDVDICDDHDMVSCHQTNARSSDDSNAESSISYKTSPGSDCKEGGAVTPLELGCSGYSAMSSAAMTPNSGTPGGRWVDKGLDHDSGALGEKEVEAVAAPSSAPPPLSRVYTGVKVSGQPSPGTSGALEAAASKLRILTAPSS